MAMQGPIKVAVDGHVHLYSREPAALLRVLQQAARNLAAHAPDCELGALMLAESAGWDAFGLLRAEVEGGVIAPTDEDNSLWAQCGERPLLIVAGRQIVSAEKIEVLALGLGAPVADGRPLTELLADLRERPCLTVLPWGVGKWLGARGDLVRGALMRNPGVLLGDNAGRPAFWNAALLDRARAQRCAVLAGADPLPLPGAAERIGSFGSVVALSLSPDRPAASLLAAVRTARGLERFGRLDDPIRFAADQIRLRLRRAV
jgi:hypothetical protein